MRAIHLIDRHLPMFELGAFDLLAERANHQLTAERILRRKRCGVDGFEAS